ncbi:hypothetical protein [Haladaptatus caseinilyticus]|uniref:hypothetical protein n=1 Tax=Haladaptatus caseinilyticus TaxID=2993314 RepID=UPI00224B7208|nr:hypothetical protein [Haladaptatus caseinilyticus]
MVRVEIAETADGTVAEAGYRTGFRDTTALQDVAIGTVRRKPSSLSRSRVTSSSLALTRPSSSGRRGPGVRGPPLKLSADSDRLLILPIRVETSVRRVDFHQKFLTGWNILRGMNDG